MFLGFVAVEDLFIVESRMDFDKTGDPPSQPS